MERIASGYALPEALRAADDGTLYFSDAERGGVFRLVNGTVETLIPKRRGVGGLLLHRDGGVVVSGRSLIHVHDGVTRELFSEPNALGLNDITADASGGVLVGSIRMDWRDPANGLPGEVWRVGGPESTTLVAGEVDYPNGMALSADGGILYVADYVGRCVHAFAIENDELVSRSAFTVTDGGRPDGLAVDVEGGVWVAMGPLGTLDRYSSQGVLTERLQPPTSFVVTACFGGDEACDLYIATANSSDRPELEGSIFVTRSPVPGLRVGPATI